MTLLCFLNNEWVDLSSYIDYSSSPTITTRIDDAFASGTLKLWFDRSTPIPPYTPFKVDGEYYVGHSNINRYLAENSLYIHDVELLEAAAILGCYIVGVKIYSAESPTWSSDAKKFLSLCRITERMYHGTWFNVGIEDTSENESYLSDKITTSKTYTFNATNTLYDCLNQICVENNKKLKLIFDDSNPYVMWIRLINPDKGLAYTPSNDVFLLDQSNQSPENYGKYLETYASNVVDRTTVTKVERLELKADDALLNADTAFVELPTAIESIADFGVHQAHTYKITMTPDAYFDKFEFSAYDTPYSSLAAMTTTIDGRTVYFFEEFYNTYFANRHEYSKDVFYSDVTYKRIDASQGLGWNIEITIPAKFGVRISVRNILEKSQWDTLTPQNQATYLVYTIGNRRIENLNASYKNDIWNLIIGQARGNFLSYQNQLQLDDPLLFYGVSFFNNYFSAGGTIDSNIFHYNYYVYYYSITNPFIRDSKTTTPINETEYRPFSRSYGNTANYIDFDKLMPNMHISNETLGKVEKVIEVDRTGAIITLEAGYKCIIDNKIWYMSSVITTYKKEQVSAIITLVENYNKKAEAIGVDSQQESTANPLKGITERSIYIERTTTTSIDDWLSKNLYLRCTFYDTAGNIITNIDEDNNLFSIMYCRVSKQAYGNDLLLYCQMLDQIILDFGRSNLINNSYYEQIPYKYTTDDAECGYVLIDLGYMDYVANADNDPILLPKGTNGTFTQLMYLGYNQLDKDAREKLTFSIKLHYTTS